MATFELVRNILMQFDECFLRFELNKIRETALCCNYEKFVKMSWVTFDKCESENLFSLPVNGAEPLMEHWTKTVFDYFGVLIHSSAGAFK